MAWGALDGQLLLEAPLPTREIRKKRVVENQALVRTWSLDAKTSEETALYGLNGRNEWVSFCERVATPRKATLTVISTIREVKKRPCARPVSQEWIHDTY